MSCRLINKNAFDVPNFRLSLGLPLIFVTILIFGFIFGLIIENRIDLYVVFFASVLIIIFLIISFMIYFFTLKKITFQNDLIVIDGEKYQWFDVKIIYYDMHELITLKWETICIIYYDFSKKKIIEKYIRCKIDEYNNIMSIRNYKQ